MDNSAQEPSDLPQEDQPQCTVLKIDIPLPVEQSPHDLASLKLPEGCETSVENKHNISNFPNTDNLLDIKVIKTSLLGKEQAKRRLQAFYSSKKIEITRQKILNAFQEKVEESPLKNKLFKKGINPNDRAKAVIKEIEEIKQEEIRKIEEIKKIVSSEKDGLFTKQDERKARSKSKSRSKERNRKSSKRRRLSRSKDRHSRVTSVPKLQYPLSWKELKQNKLDVASLSSKFPEKPKNVANKGVDFREQLLFKAPARLLVDFIANGVSDQPVSFPANSIRLTRNQPSIPFCVNKGTLYNNFFNRKNILEYVPRNYRNVLGMFFSNNLVSNSPSKSPERTTLRKWYPKDATAGTLLGTSLGLSILQGYSDDEEKEEVCKDSDIDSDHVIAEIVEDIGKTELLLSKNNEETKYKSSKSDKQHLDSHTNNHKKIKSEKIDSEKDTSKKYKSSSKKYSKTKTSLDISNLITYKSKKTEKVEEHKSKENDVRKSSLEWDEEDGRTSDELRMLLKEKQRILEEHTRREFKQNKKIENNELSPVAKLFVENCDKESGGNREKSSERHHNKETSHTRPVENDLSQKDKGNLNKQVPAIIEDKNENVENSYEIKNISEGIYRESELLNISGNSDKTVKNDEELESHNKILLSPKVKELVSNLTKDKAENRQEIPSLNRIKTTEGQIGLYSPDVVSINITKDEVAEEQLIVQQEDTKPDAFTVPVREVRTPDTDDYFSDWESDGNSTSKSNTHNRSWEIEDETTKNKYRGNYKSKDRGNSAQSAFRASQDRHINSINVPLETNDSSSRNHIEQQRFLEMPFNLTNVKRDRFTRPFTSTPNHNDFDLDNEKTYSSILDDSWGKNELLSIKTEELIEQERLSLIEQRRQLEIERQRFQELEREHEQNRALQDVRHHKSIDKNRRYPKREYDEFNLNNFLENKQRSSKSRKSRWEESDNYRDNSQTKNDSSRHTKEDPKHPSNNRNLNEVADKKDKSIIKQSEKPAKLENEYEKFLELLDTEQDKKEPSPDKPKEPKIKQKGPSLLTKKQRDLQRQQSKRLRKSSSSSSSSTSSSSYSDSSSSSSSSSSTTSSSSSSSNIKHKKKKCLIKNDKTPPSPDLIITPPKPKVVNDSNLAPLPVPSPEDIKCASSLLTEKLADDAELLSIQKPLVENGPDSPFTQLVEKKSEKIDKIVLKNKICDSEKSNDTEKHALVDTKNLIEPLNKDLIESEKKDLKESECKYLKQSDLKGPEKKDLKESESKDLKVPEKKDLKVTEKKDLKEAEKEDLKESEKKDLKEPEKKEPQEKGLKESDKKGLKESEKKNFKKSEKNVPPSDGFHCDDRSSSKRKRKENSPRGKYHNGSPKRIRRRSISPLHSDTYRKRDYSSRRNDYSPKRRDISPRRRDYSPRRYNADLSPNRSHRKESIQEMLQRLAGMDPYYIKKKSPLRSPVHSFKRSVADSTISDEQLLQYRSEDNVEVSKSFSNQTIHSPKQELDVSIDYQKNISVLYSENYQYSQDSQHYYEQYQGPKYNEANRRSNYSRRRTVNQDVLQALPFEDNAYTQPLQQNEITNTTPHIKQVGNILEIIPTEGKPDSHTSSSVCKYVTSTTLPVLPKATESTPKTASSPTAITSTLINVCPAVNSAVPPVAKPSTELSPGSPSSTSIPSAMNTEVIIKQKMERRAEKRRKKLKREEKRRIKKSKLLNELSSIEDVDWPVPEIVFDSTHIPPEKGILVKITRFSESSVELNHSETKRSVKFSDGILPGEGTSPSGGEEWSSPPPTPKKMPKEKRLKTKLAKATKVPKKKKVKVKVIRRVEEEDEDDDLPPPPPPPGSPPPHLFPTRIKPVINNIHPSVAVSIANSMLPDTSLPPQAVFRNNFNALAQQRPPPLAQPGVPQQHLVAFNSSSILAHATAGIPHLPITVPPPNHPLHQQHLMAQSPYIGHLHH